MSETVGLISLSIMGKHMATNQMKAGHDPVVRTSTGGLRRSAPRPTPSRLARQAVEALTVPEMGGPACPRDAVGETESGRRR